MNVPDIHPNWNTKPQKDIGQRIFGNDVAFASADEEQGRKTLHMHIQLWVKDASNHGRAV